MFIHGSYNASWNMPTYAQTYYTILNNNNLLPNLHVGVHGASLGVTVTHPQIILGLAPILYENPKIMFEITHRGPDKLSDISQETLEKLIASLAYKHERVSTLPRDADTSDMPNVNVQIWHINNPDKVFETLTKDYSTQLVEAKHLSLGLQTNIRHKIRVYQNENTVTIITSSYNWALLRKIIALLPNIFPNKITLSELARTSLDHFATENAEWYHVIKQWFDSHQLYINHLKGHLLNIMDNLSERNIEDKQLLIIDYKKQNTSLIQQLDSNLDKIQNLKKEIYALKIAPNNLAEDLTDYINYLNSNKQVVTISTHSYYLELLFRTPITYFEPDVLDIYFKNKQSIVNDYGEYLKTLLRKIFINKEYNVYTYTGIRINLNTLRWENSYEHIRQDDLVQPHLMSYNCWGNNEPHITTHLKNCNFILATEQMIASSMNLNFIDTTVFSKFVHTIAKPTNIKDKCLEHVATGEFYSLTDVYDQIKKEAKKNETYQVDPTSNSSIDEGLRTFTEEHTPIG